MVSVKVDTRHPAQGAVIVLCMTAWAYALAYFFEYGYLAYFGVPSDFIRVTTITIIFAIFAVFITVTIISYYGLVAATFFEGSKKYSRTRVIIFQGILFFVCFSVIPYLAGLYGVALKIGIFIILLGLIGYIRILCHPGRSLEEKLMKMEKKHSRLDKPFVLLEKLLGIRGIGMILFVMVTFGISFVVGSAVAKMKTTFPVSAKDDTRFAVIRIYDSQVIAMPFSAIRKNELQAQVTPFNFQSSVPGENLFSIEKLEQLHVAN